MRARPGISAEGRAHGGGDRRAGAQRIEGRPRGGHPLRPRRDGGGGLHALRVRSYAFPPDYKPSIIDLRKWMRRGRRKITREMLGECEADIRKAYLDMSRSLFRLPTLCNTDGEPFVMQTLHYEIDSAARAFSGLAGLCVTESEDELRALAKPDERGAVAHVEIPWTPKGPQQVGAGHHRPRDPGHRGEDPPGHRQLRGEGGADPRRRSRPASATARDSRPR